MNIKQQVKEKLGHVVQIDVTLNLSIVKRVLTSHRETTNLSDLPNMTMTLTNI